MAKSKAPVTTLMKREETGPLAPWEEELALQATEDRAKEVGAGERISTKGGHFTIDGNMIPGDKITVAIIDYNFEKSYYENPYVDGVVQTPDCYAFGREDKGMVPVESAPAKQAEKCDTCPHNRFGTADVGKGKRCKDHRRLMCIIPGSDPESIAKAEMRMLSIPTGSLKDWQNYLAKARDLDPRTQNIRTLLTEIAIVPYKSVFKLTFKAVDRLPPEAIRAIAARRKDVEAQLFAPYPVIEAEEAQPEQKARSTRRAKKLD